jgi:hypothetical protein
MVERMPISSPSLEIVELVVREWRGTVEVQEQLGDAAYVLPHGIVVPGESRDGCAEDRSRCISVYVQLTFLSTPAICIPSALGSSCALISA